MSGSSPVPTAEFPAQTPYILPDFRTPSPASSLGTKYDPDETSPSDWEIDDETWDKKMQGVLALDEMSEAERLANEDPKLPKPKTQAEERQLHEQVMAKLRAAVDQLGEDERFEQLASRGSRIETQPKPVSGDLDVILQSLMAIPIGQPIATSSTYRSHVRATSGDFDSRRKSLAHIPPPQPPSDGRNTDSISTTGPGQKPATRRKTRSRKT
ncbi:hypothetical protein NEOLEDRAFT_1060813 [Neolentinus lepideus HHB14362 ss-1]|uniref:Uncharacterized protein n=1 Tax=Neolentinus lepideus HHB14362 ss-1 TaxID=1314782 RepID=A0A165TZY0_9AGAM|nr:hypothetical protein NEOLEDRAFT_1060813 [Neolentinus lepideus HHB14362 ss-1]